MVSGILFVLQVLVRISKCCTVYIGEKQKVEPNDRTCQRNMSQYCWAQHVACVWPPYCDVLRHVGCCWLKFENGQI